MTDRERHWQRLLADRNRVLERTTLERDAARARVRELEAIVEASGRADVGEAKLRLVRVGGDDAE